MSQSELRPESPAPAIVVHRDAASTNLSLTTSNQAVPGIDVLVEATRPTSLAITAVFAVYDSLGDAGWSMAIGEILLDGVVIHANEPAYLKEVTAIAGADQGATVPCTAAVDLDPGDYHVTLRGRKLGATGTVSFSAPDTNVLVLQIG